MTDDRITIQQGPTSRTDRRAFIALGLTAVAGSGAAVLIGRAGFAQDGTPAALDEASPSASPAASPVTGAGAAEFLIAMVDLAYEPAELTITADTDVVISLPNEGQLEHNFVIDELGIVSETADGGDETSVTINAAAGEYEFYCSIPGHREAGMVGTLTVE